MTEQMQTIRDDLAYLRAMAEEGRRTSTPVRGAIIAAGGFIFGAASLWAWAVMARLVPGAAYSSGWAWLVAMAVFYVVLFLVLRRPEYRRDRKRGSAVGMGWSALGVSITVIVVSTILAAQVTGSPLAYAALPSTIISLYGAAWLGAAWLSKQRWLAAVGAASFAAAVSLAVVAGSPNQFLGYALALIFLAGVPGLVLMRRP